MGHYVTVVEGHTCSFIYNVDHSAVGKMSLSWKECKVDVVQTQDLEL